MGGLWALASPLFSVADEPSHAIWAAAVARGQLSGKESVIPLGRGKITLTTVGVPEGFADFAPKPRRSASGKTFGVNFVPCFGSRPDLTADCAPQFKTSGTLIEVPTYTGRYPPAIYFLMGLPSLIFPSSLGIYLMRFVGVGLSAALLSSAFLSVRQLGTPAIGLALAISPTALFYAASVNPNGVEIAAAIGLWSSLAALLLRHKPEHLPSLVRRAATAAVVLSVARFLGPLWVVITISTIALIAEKQWLIKVIGSSVTKRAGTVVLGAFIGMAAWYFLRHPASSLIQSPAAQDLDRSTIAHLSIGKRGNDLLQMIGVFGWVDTPAPWLTYFAWIISTGLLFLLALAENIGRRARVLVGLTVLTVLVPVILEETVARSVGFGWWGRYGLPIGVGIPILAAYLAGKALEKHGPRLIGMVTGLIVVGHVLAFAGALRRYTIGVGWFGPPQWSPPIPSFVLALAFVAACGAYGRWIQSFGSPPNATNMATLGS